MKLLVKELKCREKFIKTSVYIYFDKNHSYHWKHIVTSDMEVLRESSGVEIYHANCYIRNKSVSQKQKETGKMFLFPRFPRNRETNSWFFSRRETKLLASVERRFVLSRVESRDSIAKRFLRNVQNGTCPFVIHRERSCVCVCGWKALGEYGWCVLVARAFSTYRSRCLHRPGR